MGYKKASMRFAMAKISYHKLKTEKQIEKSESYNYFSANTYIVTYVTACYLYTPNFTG